MLKSCSPVSFASGGVSSEEDTQKPRFPADFSHAFPVIREVCFALFSLDLDTRYMTFQGPICDMIPALSFRVELSMYLRLVPEDERADTVRKYMGFIGFPHNDGDTCTFEHSLLPKEDVRLLLRVSLQYRCDDGGTYIWGIASDRTEYSPELFVARMLSHRNREYAVCFDKKRERCFVNESLKNLLSLDSSRIDNALSYFSRVVHPEDKDALLSDIRSSLRDENECALREYRLISGQGNEVWVHPYAVSAYDSPGGTKFIAALFADVSERKKKEQVHRNIIESSSAIVFVADLCNDEVTFSDNLQTVFPKERLHRKDSILDLIRENIHPDDVAHVLYPAQEMIAGVREKFACEFRILRGEETIWFASRGAVYTEKTSGHRQIVGTMINLNEMNRFKKYTDDRIHISEITGLPLRARLIGDTERVLHDRNVFSVGMILFDIREFHALNDRFGHDAGNEILLAVKDRLHAGLPSGASLYHIGTDLYAVLWAHATRIQIDRYLRFVSEELAEPFVIQNSTICLLFALSAALYPVSGRTAEELLVNAEITLHKVKKEKKTGYAIYTPNDRLELTEKLDFEMQLSSSLRNIDDHFRLYYQPLISANGEHVVGAEGLLRWVSPLGDVVDPERVIAGLSSGGFMENIGNWVLETGIAQCKKWIDDGADRNFFLHLNITAEDLMRPDFSKSVLERIRRHGITPSNLVLEITESSLMKNMLTCRENLIALRNEGVKISLDDFGSGYSSLNYLRELPIDEVKLDKAFLADAPGERYNPAFLSAIVILAHSMHTRVCIEGIETKEHAANVRALNADLYQGYYFGRPVAQKEYEMRFLPRGR